MNTLAERLRYAMEVLPTRKIKGVEVARAVGVTPPSVSDWLSGKSKSMEGENLIRVSKFLKVDSTWLATGKGSPEIVAGTNFPVPRETELAEIPHGTIPVISWVQAGRWTPVMTADLTDVIEHLPCDPRAGKNGFALIVKGISMEPEFHIDDRIYVNPDVQIDELKSGALVVMSCDGDHEATFKELIVEGGKRYLRALNPHWVEPIISLDESCRLVGKVVGKYVVYK